MHLFKEDWLTIHKKIAEHWTQQELPVAYIREGDGDLLKQYEANGLAVKSHPAGYRSVHYVFNSMPEKRLIPFEVQVRTIFEEGWSEIDHSVRYPRFSENTLVTYFLTIFNRMAGSADEMGSFVKNLTSELSAVQEQVTLANNQRDQTLQEMEKVVASLEASKIQSTSSIESIAKLKQEVASLKQRIGTRDDGIGSFLDFLGKNKLNVGADVLDNALRSPNLNKLARLGLPPSSELKTVPGSLNPTTPSDILKILTSKDKGSGI